MTVHNPFLPTRFEYESSPLIWRSPHALELEKQQSYFLKGTRGSGKTSILKSINWKERISNYTLRDQIDQNQWNCLAVYFRLPDHMSQAINSIDWASVTPSAPSMRAVAYQFFSLFVESIALEALLEAIVELRAKGHFSYELDRELSIVAATMKKFPELELFDLNGGDSGFPKMRRIFDRLHHEMNISATRGSLPKLLDKLPKTESGELLKFVAQSIYPILTPHCDRREFHFKVCIDDCETLRGEQQIFLNSLVRTSKAPVCWVVSFVKSDYESAATIIHNQKLSDSDRKVIDLEEITPSEFRDLCEAVASLRLHYSIRPHVNVGSYASNPAELISLSSLLGTYSVNELFSVATRNSLGRGLPHFKERTTKLRDTATERLGSKAAQVLQLENELILPYYQNYIVENLYSGRPLEEVLTPDDKATKAFAATLRRKQVGAYLCLCSQYGVERPLYAGANVVLNMSDACIRDFLELMGAIYEAHSAPADKKLLQFVNRRSPIPIKTQSRGIERSSKQKLLGIEEGKDALDVLTAEVAKLVEGLGHLTAKLQATPSDKQALRTTERGIFMFDLAKVPQGFGRDAEEMGVYISQVVKRATLDGLLRPVEISTKSSFKKSNAIVGYRLHKRYAAHFGFSYRGAYEAVALDMNDVIWLCSNADEADARDWAGRVHSKIAELTPDQSEFDFE
jgi:hypothetical protein